MCRCSFKTATLRFSLSLKPQGQKLLQIATIKWIQLRRTHGTSKQPYTRKYDYIEYMQTPFFTWDHQERRGLAKSHTASGSPGYQFILLHIGNNLYCCILVTIYIVAYWYQFILLHIGINLYCCILVMISGSPGSRSRISHLDTLLKETNVWSVL